MPKGTNAEGPEPGAGETERIGLSTFLGYGLASKLNGMTMGVILATSLGIAAFLITHAASVYRVKLIDHGRSVASFMAQNSSEALRLRDERVLEKLLRSLHLDSALVYGAFLGPEGEILAEKRFLAYAKPFRWSPSQLHSIKGLEVTEFTANERPFIDFLAPILFERPRPDSGNTEDPSDPGESPIIGYVQLSFSQEETRKSIGEFTTSATSITLLVLLLGSVLTLAITYSISSPIKKLAKGAESLAKGEYTQVDIHNRDEIGDLARAFNEMVVRLQDYHQQLVQARDTLEARVRERTDELRRATQEAVESAAKAEEASRVKSEFLANMSHEIRTPLNGIIGTAELLQTSGLSPKQRNYAELLTRSAEGLLRIINDILDISKLEAGKFRLEIVDFELDTFLDDSIALYADLAHRKSLELTATLDGDVPRWVTGDPDRLRQILSNIVSNAIKFTERGWVKVSVKKADRPGLIRFEVSDTGIGIRPEKQSEIFEHFSQEDTSTTRKYGGTGLGLAIARELCQLMGGAIGVESYPGLGSTFWFVVELPCSESELVSQPGPKRCIQAKARTLDRAECEAAAAIDPMASGETTQAERNGFKVLLAEDNAVNQELAMEMLKSLGLEVDIVDDGVGVLQAWISGAYDLILMDCQMPNLDGYEATRAIRQRELSGDHVPIVALTAHAMEGDRQKCLSAGMDDYLSKPFGREQLSVILNRWLHHRTNGGRGDRNDAVEGEVPSLAEAESFARFVDQKALNEIQALDQDGSAGILTRVVKIYLKDAPTLLERVGEAIRDLNAEQLRLSAHSLKSSSAQVGALKLSEFCKQLEALGRKNSISGAEEILIQALEEYRGVQIALEKRLG